MSLDSLVRESLRDEEGPYELGTQHQALSYEFALSQVHNRYDALVREINYLGGGGNEAKTLDLAEINQKAGIEAIDSYETMMLHLSVLLSEFGRLRDLRRTLLATRGMEQMNTVADLLNRMNGLKEPSKLVFTPDLFIPPIKRRPE